MSAVVGIDLSSKAIDLVKLDESSNRAEWVRCELTGRNAWERTLTIRNAFPPVLLDDVYLVAIEAPYGRGHAGSTSILNRVVGAIAAALPSHLRQPECCWIVAPHEWKAALGIKVNAKPTKDDLNRIAPDGDIHNLGAAQTADQWQNAWDAYCLALWARNENAKGVEAA